MMKFLIQPRRAGKTHKLVHWVLEGEKTASYPGWSRVLITPTMQRAAAVRREYPMLDYRQVFYLGEWQKARLGAGHVEVALDDADDVLRALLGGVNTSLMLASATEDPNARA